jgi:hypothetical protein
VEAAILARAFAVIVAGDEKADDDSVPARERASGEAARVVTVACL